jgi:hypothetical protein
MSHLLEVLVLMITISILPFPCINTIWQKAKMMMQPGNMGMLNPDYGEVKIGVL